MTELLRAALLGALQGATEFLPVSSSGHVLLVPALLGWPLPSLAFDAMVHVATACAAGLYLRRDWWRMSMGLAALWRSRALTGDEEGERFFMVLLAVVPAGLAGLLLRDAFMQLFAAPRLAGWMLFVTAGLLVVAELVSRRRGGGGDQVGPGQALPIGVAQAVAIIPGISRSGATIAGGQLAGLARRDATRFSFLVAVPTILGAGLVEATMMAAEGIEAAQLAYLVVGGLSAFVVGYLTVGWMLAFVTRHSLLPFAAYTAFMGLVALARL